MTQKKMKQRTTSEQAEQLVMTRNSQANVEMEARREHIAMIAYCRAKDRNFEPGHEMEDWLKAEQEVNADSSQQV
jgi:hypothetical protein